MFSPIEWASRVFTETMGDVNAQRQAVYDTIAEEACHAIGTFRAIDYCADVVARGIVAEVPGLDLTRIRSAISKEIGMAVQEISEPLRAGFELS